MTTATRMMPTTTKVDLTVADVLGKIGNKFFSIEFVKKTDGSIRKMPSARFGVVKHVKGTGKKSSSKSVVTVYDMGISEYRSFDLDNVRMIKVDGVIYDFTN